MDGLKGVALIVLIIALIVFGPMLFIWSTNKLFGLNIPQNLEMWFTSLVFLSMVRGGGSRSSS